VLPLAFNELRRFAQEALVLGVTGPLRLFHELAQLGQESDIARVAARAPRRMNLVRASEGVHRLLESVGPVQGNAQRIDEIGLARLDATGLLRLAKRLGMIIRRGVATGDHGPTLGSPSRICPRLFKAHGAADRSVSEQLKENEEEIAHGSRTVFSEPERVSWLRKYARAQTARTASTRRATGMSPSSAGQWLNRVKKIGRCCRREPRPRKYVPWEHTMADAASAQSAGDFPGRGAAGDTAAVACAERT
jgi:hypothetical protein